jgi:hypothetical protein
VLKYAVLINPMVYASEGLRGALVPHSSDMPGMAAVGALIVMDGPSSPEPSGYSVGPVVQATRRARMTACGSRSMTAR